MIEEIKESLIEHYELANLCNNDFVSLPLGIIRNYIDILNKHDNQPDYVRVQNGKECYCTERYRDEQFRKAFKELQEEYSGQSDIDIEIQIFIQQIEQKYNLGGE